MNHAWTETGTYPVRAQAQDQHAVSSDWSAGHAISIGNLAPNPPARPSGADTGAIRIYYAFSTSAIDPDGDSVSLQFDWGDGDSSYCSAMVENGKMVTVSNWWSAMGSYSIRARARDVAGALGPWSPEHRMCVDNSAPDVPAPPAGPSTWRTTLDCQFSVSTHDPNGDSVAYQIDWGDSSMSGWSSFVPSGVAMTMSHAWANPNTYVVQARARDTRGALSYWSMMSRIVILPLGGNNLKWWFPGPAYARFSTPAIGSDGTIYASASDGGVYALSPDGELRWTTVLGSGWPSPVALGSDDVIFASSEDGLHALYPDGALKWFARLGSSANAPTVGHDGRIYVAAADTDRLFCIISFNPDGSRGWRTGIRSSPDGNVALTVGPDGTIFAPCRESLYALSPDGAVRWRTFDDAGFMSSATIASDGTIYVGLHHGGALCAKHPDGSEYWHFAGSPSSVLGAPSLSSDGTIYCGEYMCELSAQPESIYFLAIHPDGSVKWRLFQGYECWTSPAITADGTVYLCNELSLYALTAEGAVNWVWQSICEPSSPTVGSDGTVCFGADGIYALVGSSPLANTAWPKYQHDLRNSGCAGAR